MSKKTFDAALTAFEYSDMDTFKKLFHNHVLEQHAAKTRQKKRTKAMAEALRSMVGRKDGLVDHNKFAELMTDAFLDRIEEAIVAKAAKHNLPNPFSLLAVLELARD